MHNMIYVTDDVKNIKCSLSEMNAFAFENYSGKQKRFLRPPINFIAQLSR